MYWLGLWQHLGGISLGGISLSGLYQQGHEDGQ
jgi:hypothetical protein